MRGSLIICLLLATAVLAKPRPKRSLGYIKNLVTNKLFGGNSVVIVRPTLANNETYQLFKIPGYDDILIKIKRKEKSKPNKIEVKPVDPVIVNPEVAIIGSYLGTTTEKETILAIEIVKSLLQSGILTERRDMWIKELVAPQKFHLEYIDEQNVILPTQVFEEEQGHIFVPMGGMQQVNRNTISVPVYPEYPPLLVSTKVNPTPVNSLYSYKQKGPDADMTYESYNNKDVIVTRTEKEPPLPQLLKLRIAEVANIGAQPYRVNPYSYSNPGIVPENVSPEMLPYLSHRIAKPIINGTVESEYTGNNDYGAPVFIDRDPIRVSNPLSITSPYYYGNNVQQVIRCMKKNVGKVCPYDKTKRKQNPHPEESKLLQEIVVNNQNEPITNNIGETNANMINELLKKYFANDQLVSNYIYKQMNHHSHDNYTEVKVGEDIQITTGTVETDSKLPKNYVFIPPKTADSPHLSALRLNTKETSSHGKDDENNPFTSNSKVNERKHFVPSVPRLKSNVKPNVSHGFKNNPIIVSENIVENRKTLSNSTNAKTNKEDTNENSHRGDIPSS